MKLEVWPCDMQAQRELTCNQVCTVVKTFTALPFAQSVWDIAPFATHQALELEGT